MNRKNFLIQSSLAVCSISVFGNVHQEKDKFLSDCETTNDILGPFYRPKAPMTQDLTFEGLEGSRVEIKGTVYSDCDEVLEDALVEIWHCNTEGDYDNKSKDFLHRARWVTNKKGEYSFKTILPGKYLNGSSYRPAHVHFRITAENHQELISQIYFKGDPHINDDPWASQSKAEQRILPIQLEDTNGNLTVRFNIFLKKKTVSKKDKK
ncbi:MAG: hypothetical protein MI810_03530 [Flavobacteriales bacterium]|nr:hypothetical protein [Flavobacteriales bacterium]